jgi:hypothetical protein
MFIRTSIFSTRSIHAFNKLLSYTGGNMMDQFQHRTTNAEYPHKLKKEYQCAQTDTYSLHKRVLILEIYRAFSYKTKLVCQFPTTR